MTTPLQSLPVYPETYRKPLTKSKKSPAQNAAHDFLFSKERLFFEKKCAYIFQNHEYDDQLQHPLNVCKPIYMKYI